MSFLLYRQQLIDACEEVRDETNNTKWVSLVYDGRVLRVGEKGEDDYDRCYSTLKAKSRIYAYVAIPSESGQKIVVLSWCGPKVICSKRKIMDNDWTLLEKILPAYDVMQCTCEESDATYERLSQLV